MSSPYDSNKTMLQHNVISPKSEDASPSIGLFIAGAVVILIIVTCAVFLLKRKSANREPGRNKQDFRKTSHNEVSVPQCSEKDRQLLNLMTSLDTLINKDN